MDGSQIIDTLPYTDELGFVPTPSIVPSDATMKIGEFEFPKYIPKPVYTEMENFRYPSEQAMNPDDLTFLPSSQTEERYYIVPQRQ